MKNSKQIDVAEGVFKQHGRKRTRKSDWRAYWIVLTHGATLDARPILTEKHLLSTQAIFEARRTLKLRTTCFIPRECVKNPQRPRSAESEFGLKWQGPEKNRKSSARYGKPKPSSPEPSAHKGIVAVKDAWRD